MYNKKDECSGYIESEKDNRGICGISVGILPEFRNQNAATIASKKNLLNDGNTEVFYFKDATATFSSFTHEPEVVKF